MNDIPVYVYNTMFTYLSIDGPWAYFYLQAIIMLLKNSVMNMVVPLTQP